MRVPGTRGRGIGSEFFVVGWRQAFSSERSIIILVYITVLRNLLVCTGEPPPKVCPCGDQTGSGRWISGV